MLSISVVICTFERPRLLEAALRSVFALQGLDRARLDVIVVDNSDTGSARCVVDALAAIAPVPVTYRVAHPANISIARNVGVGASRAEAVALLDDDQELAPVWLTAVLDGFSRFPADVFFGPITPRFGSDAVPTPGARAMFTRASAAEAGAALGVIGRRGQSFPLSTANSIFRRVGTLDETAPFDIRFGQAGGEDLHLFLRLQQRGRRFAWLPRAAATDYIPKSRCRSSYLITRHFVGGQAFASSLIWTSPTPVRRRTILMVKAVVQMCGFPAWAALAFVRRRSTVPMLAMRFAGICGKILCGRLHPLYRYEQRELQDEAVAEI